MLQTNSQSRRNPFPDMIDAIGEEEFGRRLLSYLFELCGAEHCAVLRYTNNEPSEFLTASIDGSDTARRQVGLYLTHRYWRYDPTLTVLRSAQKNSAPGLARVEIASLPRHDLRDQIYGPPDIVDRAFICGGEGRTAFGLSVLRSQGRGQFSRGDLDNLLGQADTIIALLKRHSNFLARRPGFSRALTSLDSIESCIARAPERLPRREAEVCARIVYGVSTIGISLELEIGEETVMTYRKRIYQRLGIGSQRELMVWYLNLWGSLGASLH